jgi:hypothetical protein
MPIIFNEKQHFVIMNAPSCRNEQEDMSKQTRKSVEKLQAREREDLSKTKRRIPGKTPVL